MNTVFRSRFFACVLAFAFVLPLVGCTSKPATGTVSGSVTYGDEPLTLGKITFVIQDKGVGGSATLNEQGHFQISGDLPLGVYQVYFANSMKPGSLDPKDLILTPVSTQYRAAATSGLTFEVKKGSNVAEFRLTK